jgi:hypothetical protein
LLWLDQQDEAELQVQIAERKAPAVAAIASAPVRQTRKTLQFATVKKGIKKGIEMTLTNVVALTNWHPADALAYVGAEIKTLQAREAVLRAALLKGSSSLAGTTTTVYTGTTIGQDSFNWKTVTLM